MINAVAEWEFQEALILSIPHKNSDWNRYLDEILISYKDFIKAVINYEDVYLIAPDESFYNKFFKNEKRVKFIQIDTNDTWIRDYGGIARKNNHKFEYLNFIFNGWGDKFNSSKDNAVNKILYKKLDKKLIDIDFILEGGSIDFNSKNVMLTTTKCLLNKNRNFKFTKDEIDIFLKDIFNLDKIIWLENGFISGDDTDSHIDILARFIDDNTIAYSSCSDKNVLHFNELKAMEDELKKTGYDLIPLDIAKFNYLDKILYGSYINFCFLNNALIMPIYGVKEDEINLNKLKNHLNIDVVGVDARVFIRENGSLHCSCINLFKDSFSE